MEDNYFDKKLKGILENPPAFEPDASALLDMQQRLGNISKPKRRKRGLFLFLPLLMLPIIFGFGFLYKKYAKLSQTVTDLTEEISTLNTKNQRSTDTIYEKQIIHHYDTIATIVYIEKYIKADQQLASLNNAYHIAYENANWYPGQTNQFIPLTPNSFDWSLGNSRNSLLAKNPGSSIFNFNPYDKNELETSAIELKAVDPIDAIGLRLLPIDLVEPDWIKNLDDQLTAYQAPKVNPAYYFRPNGLATEINASPVVIPVDAFGARGKDFGLKGVILFPGGQSLEVGAEWLQMNFELKQENGDDFTIFPVVNPDDPSDVLHELKGKLSYLQIPIMLRQGFRKDHDFKPFVSVGMVAYKPIAQDFIYEFIDGTGEYKKPLNLKTGDFSVDNFRFRVGAEYAISQRFSAATAFQYQHGLSLNTNEYFKLRYWALNFGLRYRLGE